MSTARPPAVLSQEQVRAELLSDHAAVHDQFLASFGSEIARLVSALHAAHARIAEFAIHVDRDLRAAWVDAFLDSALNGLLVSS